MLASDYVAQKLNELEKRRAEVEKEAEAKGAELTILKAKAQAVRDSELDFKKLTAALRRASGMTFTNFVHRSPTEFVQCAPVSTSRRLGRTQKWKSHLSMKRIAA